ncbi:hypothetical protein HanRHA438_Chr04g0198041 [Helianthus annuus]|nr:hypothetical protein HanRHA438_Chr04g0198041 [Helianthus annuus]
MVLLFLLYHFIASFFTCIIKKFANKYPVFKYSNYVLKAKTRILNQNHINYVVDMVEPSCLVVIFFYAINVFIW